MAQHELMAFAHAPLGRCSSGPRLRGSSVSSCTGSRARASVVRHAVRACAAGHDEAGKAFAQFFETMQGVYNSERTYHYFDEEPGKGPGLREKSATTFGVRWLEDAEKNTLMNLLSESEAAEGVMKSANKADGEKSSVHGSSWDSQGMEISFYTKMESREELVISATQALFLPDSFDHARGTLSGLYTRSEGYEEPGFIISDFSFDVSRNELLMTTEYRRVVSVDQITLVNPFLRLRRILNYAKDDDGHRTDHVVLAGFGVEAKSTDGTQLVPMKN